MKRKMGWEHKDDLVNEKLKIGRGGQCRVIEFHVAQPSYFFYRIPQQCSKRTTECGIVSQYSAPLLVVVRFPVLWPDDISMQHARGTRFHCLCCSCSSTSFAAVTLQSMFFHVIRSLYKACSSTSSGHSTKHVSPRHLISELTLQITTDQFEKLNWDQKQESSFPKRDTCSFLNLQI